MIDLTPIDIRKKKGDFSRSLRGYDVADVDMFLDLVADRLEEVVNESLLARTVIEQGSVDDPCFVEGLFERHAIDVFFHAAYGGDVNRVMQEPLECFRSSALSTWIVLDLIRRRRAVRAFTDAAVDDASIRLIVAAARWASSASNRRLHRYLVVREPRRLRLVVEKTGSSSTFASTRTRSCSCRSWRSSSVTAVVTGISVR